jgi:hypothetical protein
MKSKKTNRSHRTNHILGSAFNAIEEVNDSGTNGAIRRISGGEFIGVSHPSLRRCKRGVGDVRCQTRADRFHRRSDARGGGGGGAEDEVESRTNEIFGCAIASVAN